MSSEQTKLACQVGINVRAHHISLHSIQKGMRATADAQAAGNAGLWGEGGWGVASLQETVSCKHPVHSQRRGERGQSD